MPPKACLAFLLIAGCAIGKGGSDPDLKFRITNHGENPFDGIILRFDIELERADRVGGKGFVKIDLRLTRADTVHLSGGRLAPGESATYVVTGRDGEKPAMVEGRWLRNGKRIRVFGPYEYEVR